MIRKNNLDYPDHKSYRKLYRLYKKKYLKKKNLLGGTTNNSTVSFNLKGFKSRMDTGREGLSDLQILQKILRNHIQNKKKFDIYVILQNTNKYSYHLYLQDTESSRQFGYLGRIAELPDTTHLKTWPEIYSLCLECAGQSSIPIINKEDIDKPCHSSKTSDCYRENSSVGTTISFSKRCQDREQHYIIYISIENGKIVKIGGKTIWMGTCK
jgi:hypothetical protein